jgi:hypothetical protein
MPGHVKLGSSSEPDPDPLPYLVISNDMRRADMAKPYDSKKSIWVPGEGADGGFIEALLDSEAGGKTTAILGHEVLFLLKDDFINDLDIVCIFLTLEKDIQE